jgi:molybdopterin-containing oxidoreductase family iron-sulfur binding subunit
MTRLGKVIDLKKCAGCYACVAACKAEHATPKGVVWCRVVKHETGSYPSVRRVPLPLQCMHCADPPCEQICPTGATQKRADGLVFVDYNLCMGCRACRIACPYQARYFLAEIMPYYDGQGLTPYEQHGYQANGYVEGTVTKCNFCAERLAEGKEPACSANCPGKARYFGDLSDPESEVSRLIRERRGFQLHAEFGTDPSVYYLPP